MGIAYRLDAVLGCAFVVWDREITADEWRDQNQRLFADPGFPPGALALADLSTAGGAAGVSPEVVEQMAIVVRDRADGVAPMRLAVVANGTWDKARALERGVEGSRITTIVFNELFTACTWLGLDVAVATAILAEMRAGLVSSSSPD